MAWDGGSSRPTRTSANRAAARREHRLVVDVVAERRPHCRAPRRATRLATASALFGAAATTTFITILPPNACSPVGRSSTSAVDEPERRARGRRASR